MTNIIWHNSTFKNDEPILTIHDRLRLGEGVFNTILCIDRKLMHGDLHIKKLLVNSKILFGEWNHPNAKELEKTAQDLLEKNNANTGYYAFNTILSLGPAGNGIRTPETPDIQIMMRVLPAPKTYPAIHAIVAQNVRRNEGSPLSQFKCSNYGDNILALREATNKDANEALMMNNAGNIATATTSNIIAEINGKLVTPPLTDGCQNGITRAILIKKLNITEQSLTPRDIKSAQGLYLINSLRGAMPITTLDGIECPKPTIHIDQYFHHD